MKTKGEFGFSVELDRFKDPDAHPSYMAEVGLIVEFSEKEKAKEGENVVFSYEERNAHDRIYELAIDFGASYALQQIKGENNQNYKVLVYNAYWLNRWESPPAFLAMAAYFAVCKAFEFSPNQEQVPFFDVFTKKVIFPKTRPDQLDYDALAEKADFEAPTKTR